MELYKESKQLSDYEKDYDAIVEHLPVESYPLTPPLSSITGLIHLPYWGHWTPAAHLVAATYMSDIIEAWLLQKHGPGSFPQGLR